MIKKCKMLNKHLFTTFQLINTEYNKNLNIYIYIYIYYDIDSINISKALDTQLSNNCQILYSLSNDLLRHDHFELVIFITFSLLFTFI